MARPKKIIPAELPAGAPRNEAKAIVADQLAEQGEKEFANVTAFDPSKLEIENEIAQHYNTATNEFEVTDAVEGYCYLWGRRHPKSHAEIMSRVGRYLGNRIPGYELVSGPQEKFPECWQLRAEDGTRRIGDVQLYRVRKQVWDALQECYARDAKAREMGVSSGLMSRAARYPRYVRATETEGDPMEFLRDRARTRGGIPREAYDRAVIESLTVHKIAEDARTGNLHGIPLDRAIRKSK